MVMMHSPKSDSGPPTSPVSSNSPPPPPSSQSALMKELKEKSDSLNNNNNSNNNNNNPNNCSSEKSAQQKFTLISPNSNKENTIFQSVHPAAILNEHHLVYPRGDEPSAKFSIERLKQLADHNICRLSPSTDHLTTKYSIDHTAVASAVPRKTSTDPSVAAVEESTVSGGPPPPPPALVASFHPTVVSAGGPTMKFFATAGDFDLERLKLARVMAASNGQAQKELSDFGFRIQQLGGLQACNNGGNGYARSDTSEELNVDGNDDSSQDVSVSEIN